MSRKITLTRATATRECPIRCMPNLASSTGFLTSSGLRELDDILGGGLLLGSMIGIQEEWVTKHARLFGRYFIAQGVDCQHATMIVLMNEDCQTIVEKLPFILNSPGATVADAKNSHSNDSSTKIDNQSSLKIAWQYEKYVARDRMADKMIADESLLTATEASQSGVRRTVRTSGLYCQSFDIQQSLQKSLLHLAPPTCIPLSPTDRHQLLTSPSPLTHSVIQRIKSHILLTEQQNHLNVIRIYIEMFASDQWVNVYQPIPEQQQSLLKFIYDLRILSRGSNVIVTLTLPASSMVLDADPQFRQKLYCAMDTLLSVDSYAAVDMKGHEFRDFSGTLTVGHLPLINSFVLRFPEHPVYLYKVGRRKLQIEKMHLPPADVGSSGGGSSHDPSCSSSTSTNNKYSF